MLSGCARRVAGGEDVSDDSSHEMTLEEVTDAKEEVTIAVPDLNEPSGTKKIASGGDKTNAADVEKKRTADPVASTDPAASAADKTDDKTDDKTQGEDKSTSAAGTTTNPAESRETTAAKPGDKTGSGGGAATVTTRSPDTTKAGGTGGSHELPAIPLR